MITPDMYSAEDFQRGTLLIDACVEVRLASLLRQRPPAPDSLTAPFNAYLQATKLTPETFEAHEIDPDVAMALARRGLSNQLQQQQADASAARSEQARRQLGQVLRDSSTQAFAIFPVSDGDSIQVTQVEHSMNGTKRTQEAAPAVVGFRLSQTPLGHLSYYTIDQPPFTVGWRSFETPIFTTETDIEPAIRLAITDTAYVPPEPHPQTPPRGFRIGKFTINLGG